MSARKLSRLAGLVLVLAAVFGGIGAASVAQQGAVDTEAATFATLDAIWT